MRKIREPDFAIVFRIPSEDNRFPGAGASGLKYTGLPCKDLCRERPKVPGKDPLSPLLSIFAA